MSVLDVSPQVEQLYALAAQNGWAMRGGRLGLTDLGLAVARQHPNARVVLDTRTADAQLAIVAPVLNRERELPMFFRSIAAQRTDAPFHVVIADDGSEDDSLAVITKLAKAMPDHIGVCVVALERAEPYVPGTFTFGAGVARNAALAQVRSPRVLFVDPDQTLSDDCVEQHDRLAKLDFDVVLGIRTYQESDPGAVQRVIRGSRRYLDTFQAHGRWWPSFFTGNASVAHDLLVEVGGFDETLQCWGLEDIDLAYRLERAGARFWHTPRAKVQHLIPRHRGSDRIRLPLELDFRADREIRPAELLARPLDGEEPLDAGTLAGCGLAPTL